MVWNEYFLKVFEGKRDVPYKKSGLSLLKTRVPFERKVDCTFEVWWKLIFFGKWEWALWCIILSPKDCAHGTMIWKIDFMWWKRTLERGLCLCKKFPWIILLERTRQLKSLNNHHGYENICWKFPLNLTWPSVWFEIHSLKTG